VKNSLFIVLLAVTITACSPKQPSNNKENIKLASNNLTSWSNDTRYDTDTTISKQTIIKFIEAVTSKESSKYIPVEDRIAVFDLDGTLACERPLSMELTCSAQLALGKTPSCNTNADSLQNAVNKKFHGYLPGNITSDSLISVFSSYSATVKNNCIPINKPTNMVLCNQFYKPMIELIEYLRNNQFDVYIVSGSSQQFIRGLVKNVKELASLPPSHIIGSLQNYKKITHPDGWGPEFYLDSTNFLSNVSQGKAINIYNLIGKNPVFAFGNTVSDFDMFSITSSNPNYSTLCILLNHDSKDMEDAYQPFEASKKVCKNWNQENYCDSIWNNRIFRKIMSDQKWKIANMSECFLIDSVFHNKN
jgi:2-hydroxy-3-keto-5-methylthiopentenyl-1-phosphate phosphatase